MRYPENHEKSIKKPESNDTEGTKFMKKYKYFGLNLQNSSRLTALIDSLKIKLKKNDKYDFPT
jgi:hypothetical protein